VRINVHFVFVQLTNQIPTDIVIFYNVHPSRIHIFLVYKTTRLIENKRRLMMSCSCTKSFNI